MDCTPLNPVIEEFKKMGSPSAVSRNCTLEKYQPCVMSKRFPKMCAVDEVSYETRQQAILLLRIIGTQRIYINNDMFSITSVENGNGHAR